ncbi:ATP-binding domain-containing protein [Trinickia caryophylli]|uniref:UvrD-like helicase C-terminal domain-containing protein n=1 Tax=Trinickia caryophylli TaxID=28094 RepID=A0A1X7CUT3_TRICW|nr:ATP-binding domain-containing protein [Trinickia caryophylli]PMS13598.1 nuclease [Trinickia caryophylli]TRX13743.1 nuclease [Trinickia caryophylli]WQE15336.1 ATP-binding domain-containing protein [Trinickia caryophylli]SMF03467.1 UvrD-like helicase C-terminal domain-containing protein [Trinickia caryophylli]GLU30906.1 nuclease [Trinickia caryophylli]
MARLIPDDWKNVAAAGTAERTGAAERERETLAVLEAGLPADYTVYHGVHWTRLNGSFSVFGEADFVVVSPAGRLLLVEQKAGFLRETPKGLVKVYLQTERNVAIGLARTTESLHRRFTAAFGAGTYGIEALLYCPDYVVRDAAIAGVAPERIIDATRKDQLVAAIVEALPPDEPRLASASKIHHFLADELSLTPDASALVGQAGTLVTRLSGGLATWARRLQFEPFRLRVIGTAGSGKTQLAIQVMKDAAFAGKRALYVCFNRPLADHIARVAPEGVKVANYHQLCDWVARDVGRAPDFQSAGVFAQLELEFARAPIGENLRFDVLIVDEGQDFQEPWVDALGRLLRPDGAWWWLEDPLQNLYMREPVALPGWTVLTETTNYRSPRDILDYVRDKVGAAVPYAQGLASGSPFGGSQMVVTSYDETVPGGAIEATKRAITQALAFGFRKQDIAVLSFRGREASAFTSVEQLGPHRVKSFTGKYDLFGNPEYRDGDVLLESIYRFKGQSAPCVVLTEVDFDVFDERTARKLFVGATRAAMKLIVVASQRAATQLRLAD